MNTLFKLTTPIVRATVKQFEAEHGFKPTREADLTEYGYAWGSVETQPELTAVQMAVPADPVLDGAFVTQGWTVRDKTEAEILDALPYKTAAEARLTMVKWIDGLTAQVMDQYPRAVQARWSIEEAAARAVKAGTATQDQTDLVTNEGAAKGRTPEEHADRIIANADRFRAIADQINTLFLATDAALAAETDPANFEGILNAAIARAAPLATAYGLDT